MDTQTGWMRNREGLGVWEHRGKVAVAGVGHSPVDRRWDEQLEHSLGAYAILAAQRAMADAGISPDDVDGVISGPGPLGDDWAPPEERSVHQLLSVADRHALGPRRPGRRRWAL
jgi:3-oxoacyl-[acyl-carrier-protein] synthase III